MRLAIYIFLAAALSGCMPSLLNMEMMADGVCYANGAVDARGQTDPACVAYVAQE